MAIRTGLKHTFALAAALLALALPAAAQQQNHKVGIVTGGVGGTYVVFGSDIAKALDSPAMRVLPMLGKGSRQNIQDLLELDGVDFAIVQTDVLQAIDEAEYPDARQAIHYVTKLYNEEVHVLARAGITDVHQLQDKFVAVGGIGSGTEMTANLLFRDMGISVEQVNDGGKAALDELLDPNGLLDAMIYVAGKPASLFESIPPDSGLNFAAMNYQLGRDRPYFDAALTRADYPNLVPAGTEVRTVSVGALLTVFNWQKDTPQSLAVGEFTKAFFDALPVLKSGSYHPKWGETNLYEEVPGWTRAAPAAEYIAHSN